MIGSGVEHLGKIPMFVGRQWFPSEVTGGMMQDEKSLRFIERTVPQRRPGRVEELDEAQIFLASDASS